MPYGDIANVRQLLNPATGQGTIGGAIIVGADGSCSIAYGSQAIIDAGTIIDGMIFHKYTIPLGSPPPAEIRWIANRLAAAQIIQSCKLSQADSASNFLYDKQQIYYQQAMTKLAALADGVEHLRGEKLASMPEGETTTKDFQIPGSSDVRPASGY